MSRVGLKQKTILGLFEERFRRRRERLDIVMPVAEKDTFCLKEAVTAARSCLRHKIGRIYLVYARERPQGRWFESEGVVLVYERY